MGSEIEGSLLMPLIVVLGVARATQLLMHDKVFEWPRTQIKRLGEYPRFSIECPWCTSTQLALVAVALLSWDSSRPITLLVLTALAVSLLAVLVDRIIDRSAYLADEPEQTAAKIVLFEKAKALTDEADRPDSTAPNAVAAAFDRTGDRDRYSAGG